MNEVKYIIAREQAVCISPADADKLIDRQLERAAITSVSGFAKLFTDASKVLRV